MEQGEGGEQGDPLMPLLFALAVHNALDEVHQGLQSSEYLFAYLDDVYAVCKPERVRVVYDKLADALFRLAGIRLHQGKRECGTVQEPDRQDSKA